MASKVPVASPPERPRQLASTVMSRPLDTQPVIPLGLVSVHAHPDDEASKGAGTVARYAAEGIRAALVCCTGGEEGEILNPAADTPGGARRPAARCAMAELRASVDAIGYAELYLLGYRDSGMPDTEANARPDNFANAPLDEAVGRLVAVIRREQPQVLVTYGDERAFYEHPDHIRVHEISVVGVRRRRRSRPVPRRRRAVAAVEALLLGLLVPAHPRVARRVRADRGGEPLRRAHRADGSGMGVRPTSTIAPPTTLVDVGDFLEARRARAARAPHADRSRQPLDARARRPLRETFPWEEYVLARSLVPGLAMPSADEPENDLFAGAACADRRRADVTTGGTR